MTRELRERARTAQEKAKQLETELEKVRERVTAAEEEVESERRAAEEERRKQLDAMRDERDAATADRNRAEAEAEAARADRDDALRRATAAEAERDALVEARDRAREERNAWMSRARATAAESRGVAPIAERVPAPRAEPPTERIAPPAPRAEPPTERIAPPAERDCFARRRAAHHPDRRTAGAASGRSPAPGSPAYESAVDAAARGHRGARRVRDRRRAAAFACLLGIAATTQLDYSPAPGFFDELFEGPATPRPQAAALTGALARLGRERLQSAGERRDAIFVQQGITFDASTPRRRAEPRPAVPARPRPAHPARPTSGASSSAASPSACAR